ncbi:Inositol 2-dehydrogenase [Nostocoides japonicum T1-X7]|uniref:Inositol 2-dehydrogenase n=1 Tax=Nostocoides japonicum T1-X7 TaxID=1194083 RepID=A0A077LXS5_9MICO|nr:Gfo/Idh/MocA family oxidoreductase [Tetrasphaera japonica]CCH76720.1 Inositol 2-dehydrogenase [Tetrasphaera japonica T1-X7]
MSNTPDLRVGVVGAGLMGTDHITRLTTTIAGATVSAIVEPDETRSAAATALAPGAATYTRIEDALEAGAMDAVVVATPGQFHEPVLLAALRAGLPILCEKPLTPDPESSWRVLETEQAVGRRLIQVGFMRRFDPQYRQLRDLVAAGTAGELLMVRGVHRNPAVPGSYTQQMLINDSVVHEFDVVPWLAGGTIRSVEVRYAKRNALSPAHLREPILVLMELDNDVLVDVEMNVSIQFGYQVATEAVFQRGVARIGQPEGLQLWQDAAFRIAEHEGFGTRFSAAYDAQLRAWVDATRRGEATGPSAWDGYKVAVACAAGVEALGTTGPVALDLPPAPDLYA